MQSLKDLVKWLFAESSGHFAIAVACLAACAVALVCHVPHATDGLAAVWIVLLVKLRA